MERQAVLPGARVLVSGAGFAGLAAAFWLNRLGYRVTVIEVATKLRKGGTPVDIEGETIETLTRMGLMDAVRAKALPPRGFEFKAADDSTIAVLGHSADETAISRYEIHRDDLLDILFAAIAGVVEIVFDVSIERLEEGPDAITAELSDGSRRAYALVLGCDGARSHTRRLTFEGEFSYFMGGYFYIKVAPVTNLLPPNMSQIFSVPGRTALLNGYDDQTDIVLAFRSEHEMDYDYRDRAQQRRLISDPFSGLGWKIPAMLVHVNADDEFYFDKLNQIRMPVWSKGRVTLVGDAGYCVSPVAGMGGSVAIIGAARVAEALQRHGGDYTAAFKDYEDKLRPFIEQVQEKAVRTGMATMFPSDEVEMAERDRKLTEGDLDL